MSGRRPRYVAATHLTVFAPPDHAAAVRAAAGAAAGLRNGAYERVSWTSAPGTERFTPTGDAVPARGTSGEAAASPSVRIELTLGPEDDVDSVVGAVVRAHPWERPVIVLRDVRRYDGGA